MLRWCWPTVRSLGGRGRVSFNIVRASSSFGFARKLVNEEAYWSLCSNVPRRTNLDTLVAGGLELVGSSEGVVGLPRALLSDEDCSRSSCVPTSISSPLPSNNPGLADKYEELPEDRRSVSSLKAFLSPSITTSREPTKHTANTIRSLYTSAKSRTTLRGLSATEFSALISLFGSLSMSTSNSLYRSLYASSLLNHVRNLGERSYWEFVAQLGRDKKRLHYHLDASDHYWLMCAELGRMGCIVGDDGEASHKANKLIDSARHHFLRIGRYSLHPKVYLPFIHGLLRRPTKDRVDEIAGIFVDVISHQSYTDSSTLDTLWLILTRYSSSITRARRVELLRAIVARTRADFDFSEPSHTPYNDDTPSCTIHDLVHALTSVISRFPNQATFASATRQYLRQWAVATVRELQVDLADDALVDAAWKKLLHLAIANTTSSSADRFFDTTHISMRTQSNWSTVCSLSRVERAINRIASTTKDPSQLGGGEVSELISHLWQNWLLARFELEQPVSDAILASILHVAADARSTEVVTHCQEYVSREDIRPNSAVLVEYCTALLLCGQGQQYVLQVVLAARPCSRSTVIQGVLSRLLSRDIHLACAFYGSVQDVVTDMPANVTCTFATELATIGQLGTALTLAGRQELDSAQRLKVVVAILSQLALVNHTFPLNQFYADLCQVVDTLLPSDTPLMPLDGLERNLLVLLKAHRYPHVVKILETLRNSGMRFSERFLLTAGRELVRRRHFKLAVDLLRGRMSGRRRIWLALRLSYSGAARLAAKTSGGPGTKNRMSKTEDLLRLARFKCPPRDPVAALRIPVVAYKSSHTRDIVFAYHSLLSSGRTNAARALLQETKDRIPEHRRAAMLNSLLDGASAHQSRRQSRAVRKSLEVFRGLVKDGFVPNRVTINILMKVMLRWTSVVDAQAVRALFDRVIRSGYPTGDRYSPGTAPFGTDSTAASGIPEVPQLASPIDFSRHVRPLYKMFIKAMFKRGDVMGARMVVGILKVLEAKRRVKYARYLYRRYARARNRETN